MGTLELVTFVEFMASIAIESIIILVAVKIDDDLSEKLATKDSVRSKFENSMLKLIHGLDFQCSMLVARLFFEIRLFLISFVFCSACFLIILNIQL